MRRNTLGWEDAMDETQSREEFDTGLKKIGG
jgi:hypothetical protein